MSRRVKQPITAETWVRFGLPRPLAEVQVCADRRWRVDFFWPRSAFMPDPLTVEVHGGMWAGGAHARSPKDFAKGHRVTLNGWHRLEFTPRQVETGYAAEVVRAFMAGEKSPALPPDPEDRRKRRAVEPPSSPASGREYAGDTRGKGGASAGAHEAKSNVPNTGGRRLLDTYEGMKQLVCGGRRA